SSERSRAADEQVKADEQTLQAAKVGTDGPALLELFRQQARGPTPGQLQALVRQLGDDAFEVREKASAALLDEGAPAVPLLQRAVRDSDPEVAHRARDCLQQLEARQGVRLALHTAAARLLAVRKPPEAVAVLLAYLPRAGDDVLADEV